MDTPILEMIDIKKSFSGIYALSGINLSLEEGEVHALLGENGAGKSTLMNMLAGLLEPERCRDERNRNCSSGDCFSATINRGTKHFSGKRIDGILFKGEAERNEYPS